jgi:peptidoglycan/LPS O-acetylase OafA/YrhL
MKYQPSLDGLRAIAVTAVVVYHAHQSLLPGGWAGVDVFFVLSGFLISSSLLNEAANFNRINLGKFYIKRALRLLPAFACLLIILLPVALFSKHHGTEDLNDMAMAATYLMNWNRALNWFPGGGGFVGHTWSLAMEEQFYFIWPFILLALIRTKQAAPVIIIALIAAMLSWRLYLVQTGASTARTYDGFDTHADSLLIGCAIAFTPLGPKMKSRARRLVLLPIAALLIIMLTFHLNSPRTQGFGMTLAGLAAAWIMIAALQDGFLKTLLSIKPLVYTGRISYGWYLWFYPIFIFGTHALPKTNEKPLAVIASYLAAMTSYHLVERPFLRLKERFEPKAIGAHKTSAFEETPVPMRS